ncbi:hypothetical protein [Corynebacterium otitidis]|uniref:hypothetical protein n=1 Tax=Corynebacterium otitidis TaxID=29321 RepID=UPI001F528F31|nr:hypothetical protein [Corynebacterium otitidis]
MLLDEPTAAPDLRHQEQVLELARRWARAGKAVLVELHDLNVAARYADRVVMLKEGRVVNDGAPAEVFTAETTRKVYGQEAHVLKHPDNRAPVVIPVGL